MYDICYEWKPNICATSKSLDHTTKMCRKTFRKEADQKLIQQEWRLKEKQGEQVSDVGLVKMDPKVQNSSAKQLGKRISSHVVPTVTSNSFELLDKLESDEIRIGDVLCESVAINEGWGNSSGGHG